MNEPTTILIFAATALSALVVLAVQRKAHKTRHQHSLGEMYKPVPKERTPPRHQTAPLLDAGSADRTQLCTGAGRSAFVAFHRGLS